MKNPFRCSPVWFLCLVLPLLGGCKEQQGQINSLKDRIAATREANNAASLDMQQMSQKLSLLKQQIGKQSAQRLEFETKSQKSATAEALLVKYRVELEESLKRFTESVAAYRQQYLTP